MPRSIPKALVLGSSLLIGAGLVVLGLGSSHEASGPGSVPCAAKANSVIQPQDVGSTFVTMGNNLQSSAPVGFGNRPDFVSYDGGRLVGLLSTAALAPKYRAEQDARAKALHYQTGAWPILPLEGAVVRDNAGLLEAYQANWDFRSRSDAEAFFEDIVASLTSTSGTGQRVVPFTIPGTDAATAWILASSNPQAETSVDVDLRVAGTVIQVGLRGGRELSVADGQSVAIAALARLSQACSPG